MSEGILFLVAPTPQEPGNGKTAIPASSENLGGPTLGEETCLERLKKSRNGEPESRQPLRNLVETKRTAKRPIRTTSDDNGVDGFQGVEVRQSRNHLADHDLREGVPLGRPVESDEGGALVGVDGQLQRGEAVHNGWLVM